MPAAVMACRVHGVGVIPATNTPGASVPLPRPGEIVRSIEGELPLEQLISKSDGDEHARHRRGVFRPGLQIPDVRFRVVGGCRRHRQVTTVNSNRSSIRVRQRDRP